MFMQWAYVLGEGQEVWGIETGCCLSTCVWLWTHHIVLQTQLPIFLLSPLLTNEVHTVFPAGLSFPAVHSCEKKHSAERDICSVRECPNYSWPFNHSGFGLCSICGVSHKCAPATVVNGSFVMIVLFHVPPNYHSTEYNNHVLLTSSSWL